ncbi:MAG: L,D-transpeptidase family protein [Curvibacter sp.]|jgi:L,D-transpeptidase YnhG|nr:L,D-transpeptidase family protein [Curvibacter sp.]
MNPGVFPLLMYSMAASLLGATAAHAQTLRTSLDMTRPVAIATTPQATPESRLIEIYRLTGASRTREAMQRAETLVRDHPNFQLAQLVYGDLLMTQARPLRDFGDVPPGLAQGGASQTLADLRQESQMRLKALRERPPAGAIPSQFLALSPRNRHAIAVDASRSRLYLFENTPQQLRLLADFYMSVGKSGIEKMAEGDARTPLGVYFIVSNLDPRTLSDFYGSGALPINYPNVLDSKRGKTGRGIWLHGTPPNQFARAPLASDGCVVLANPDLEFISRTVEPRTTPVVISSRLDWVAPHSVQAERKPFEDALSAWRSAKSSGDLDQLLRFYTPDFHSFGKSLAEWTPALRSEVEKVRGKPIQLKDLSFLRWKDASDTMVVTFGEVADGERSGPTKRQYWIRQGSEWKIFFEGIIG